MKYLTAFAGICLLSFTTPSLSETVTLDCQMTDLKRGGGWIPRAALIKVDTQSKAVQLLRPTAKQMNGRVDSAKLVRNGKDKMILRWIVKGTRSNSNQTTPQFNFRASVVKSSGKVSVIAKPLGYGNDFRGKGVCKIS